MIPEFGLLALIMAFAFAVVQSIIPLAGFICKQPSWISIARRAQIGQFFCCFISYSVLTYAFIQSDYSVVYVQQHSDHSLPLFYKISAVWGGHEGSLLLWITLLNCWGMLVALRTKQLDELYMAKVFNCLGWVSCGFLLFLLQTSNPFTREFVNLPLSGKDLNPILQDPGLAIHPPMLYLGYVGTAVAFAFSIALLASGEFKREHAKLIRPWVLGAWVFLTLGIILGSWWAYHELGWGGWWFWDPVENASLLPWLTATALIHGMLICEKRGVFKGWCVLLAIITFSLSLLGTFLVRSGVLVSVHAFAEDPTRGAFLLKYLAAVIIASLLLFAIQGHKLKAESRFTGSSREVVMLGGMVLLVIMMVTVLLGTLYPMIMDALNLGQLSVGEPYFNRVFTPLGFLLIGLMTIAPLCLWQSTPMKTVWLKQRKQLLIALIIASLFYRLFLIHFHLLAFLGVWLSCWLMVTTFGTVSWRRVTAKQLFDKSSMLIAHAGMAVCVLGITVTSYMGIEKDVRIAPTESVQLGDYAFTFDGTRQVNGANYTAVAGDFTVTKSQQQVAQLTGEKRTYTVMNMPLTQAGIKPGFFYDLYLAIGELLDDGAWSVRLYYKPLVRWIWLGGILMALGAILGVMRRRVQ